MRGYELGMRGYEFGNLLLECTFEPAPIPRLFIELNLSDLSYFFLGAFSLDVDSLRRDPPRIRTDNKPTSANK
jgi:hypothetical protein